MLADVKARIGAGAGAAAAWAGCLAEVEREWAELPDPYLSERAADVHAVGDQVLQSLTGAAARQMTAKGVLVARDLTPSETAGLDLGLVTGVVLAEGSPTSHAAILARARDIPVVVAAGPDVLSIPDGSVVLLDGGRGELHVDPAPEVLEEYRRRAVQIAEQRDRQLALAEQPAASRDGIPFVVAANLGSVADARAALAAGADGAGLVRTEFLFLDRSSAPDIEEQQGVYDAIAEAMAGRRITLRTLDVGGDKPLPYLPMPAEANPFLGQRGIRLSLEHRDLLHDQMVAICHTARRFPTSIMIPMVSTPGELIEARQVLLEAAGPAGLPPGLRIGTMIEVPSAALKIDAFLPHVDFVSIGTNDLTQYTLAAERGNGAVAGLSDALDPGVLRLIDHVCRAARGRVEVAVCGEAASDELAVPVLVGLGVRELSVSPSAVPRVKAAVRDLDVGRCTSLAAGGTDPVRRRRRPQAGAGPGVGGCGLTTRVQVWEAGDVGYRTSGRANSQGIEEFVGHPGRKRTSHLPISFDFPMRTGASSGVHAPGCARKPRSLGNSTPRPTPTNPAHVRRSRLGWPDARGVHGRCLPGEPRSGRLGLGGAARTPGRRPRPGDDQPADGGPGRARGGARAGRAPGGGQ